MKEFLKVYKTNFLSPIFSFSWLRLRPVVPSPGSRFWMHFFQDPLSTLLSDGTRTQKCIHKRNIASHFTIQKIFSAQAIFLHILYSICGVKWVIKFSNLSFWEPAKNKLSTLTVIQPDLEWDKVEIYCVKWPQIPPQLKFERHPSVHKLFRNM